MKSNAKLTRKEKSDLSEIVCGILYRNPSGLNLAQIAAKALNAGYRTNTNLAQTVFDVLAELRKAGSVTKHDESKKYTLVKTEPVSNAV